MTSLIPTRGQVERTLAQRIQALYREQLGHQPAKVTCQVSDENVVVVVENSITPPEKLLAQTGRTELAEQVRSDLDDAIKPQIQELIEQILNVTVLEVLSDATLETGRTGIIALLENAPNLRKPASNKTMKTTSSNKTDSDT
jgi:uncharacterized protein YbcI